VLAKNDYTISSYSYTSTKLPRRFDGFKVAFISDVHLENKDDVIRFKKIITKLKKQEIDLALFGGDLYYSKVFSSATVTSILSSVTASYGKFAVLGDEDVSNKQTKTILAQSGFEVLDNEERPLYYNDATIDLYGLSTSPKTSILQNDTFSLIFTHYPDTFTSTAGKCNLQLSGHSEGGSVVLPFVGGMIKRSHASKNVNGSYNLKSSRLMISNGVSPNPKTPYKFFAKNEIMVVTLHY
jgi:predicted MPP superfamily phosphohydrolase